METQSESQFWTVILTALVNFARGYKPRKVNESAPEPLKECLAAKRQFAQTALKHKRYLTKPRVKGRRTPEDWANDADQTVRDLRRVAQFGVQEDEWKRVLVGKNPDLAFLLDGIVTKTRTGSADGRVTPRPRNPASKEKPKGGIARGPQNATPYPSEARRSLHARKPTVSDRRAARPRVGVMPPYRYNPNGEEVRLMHVENGRVVLGTRECFMCDGAGQRDEHVPCPRYDKPQKGRPCPHCGSRRKHDHRYLSTGRKVDCDHCKGRGYLEESPGDSMPAEFWHTVEMRVYRLDREMTWVESHLAIGCVYSCVDYGEAWRSSDEQVLEKVRNESHVSVQACKVARGEALEICDHIGIFVNRGGYAVKSVFKAEETPKPVPVGQGNLFSQEVA